MTKITEPTPWQQRVLQTPVDLNLAMFGGRGGGKTVAYLFLALRHCQQHAEKARVLIVRSTWQSLNQLWDDVVELFETALPGSTSNKHEFTIRCSNGAVLSLSNLDDEKSVRKLQGQSFNLLIVDEITNFSSLSRLNKLQANLRGSTDVPVRLVYAGNPGGPLHATIARQYINGRRPWVPFTIEDGSEWIYAPSTYVDNPTIDRERYAQQIRASAGGDRALAAAWLENNWNEISGAFFADVWSDQLIVADDAQWQLPHDYYWQSRIAVDWGMSAPSVALFGVSPQVNGLTGPNGLILPKDSWFIVDEVHTARTDDPSVGKGWPPGVLAEEIRSCAERRGFWDLSGVCDDARGLQGDTLIQQFQSYGLHFKKPQKDRISGWVKLKSLMSARRDDSRDEPQIVISERCRLTLETLPLLPRDDIRREDVDTSANDHAADACRYLVASPSLGFIRSGKTRGMY